MTLGASYDYRSSTIEQDREAVKVVERRINERRRSAQLTQEDVARIVQTGYRNYRNNLLNGGINLTASQRWTDGLQQKSLEEAAKEQDLGKNDNVSRWHRVGLYTKQISGHGQKSGLVDLNENEDEMNTSTPVIFKDMEAQYWLEMVDTKHRYGTNLKWYYREWNQSDTDQNFFFWLDEGRGKHLDLEQCPRKRLDKEQIQYLTAAQRKNFLVKFEDGDLVWARNGEVLNTTKEYKNGGNDVGIVKMTKEEQRSRKQARKEAHKKARRGDSRSSSDSDTDPEADRNGVKGYADKGGTAGAGKGLKQMKARMKYYLSPRAVMDRALRETINVNTWLYVVDLQKNLYVGIKETGKFQHSSLLAGGRVLSAGLIKVHEGTLIALSPLSGHYRTGSVQFKLFLRSLEEHNTDLTHLLISKSFFLIKALETHGQITKKGKEIKEGIKKHLRSESTASTQSAGEPKLEDQELNEMIESINLGEGLSHKKIRDKLRRELPHEGIKIEDMTDDQRMERGVALVRLALHSG